METSRLKLIPLSEPEDANALYIYVTDAITRYWIGWEMSPTLERFQDQINKALELMRKGEYLGWLVYHEFKLVGYISIEPLAQPIQEVGYEINYWVVEKHWGKGFATEMLGGVLTHLKWCCDIPQVIVSYTEGNEASRRVIEKYTPYIPIKTETQFKNGKELLVYHYLLDVKR